MDTHVEEANKRSVATSDPSEMIGWNLVWLLIVFPSLDAWPGSQRHDAMVNHVKHGQVSELLPQQEEQRVKVVNELGEEIPPGHVQCKHSIIGICKFHSDKESCAHGRTWVVHRLTEPVVAASQPEPGGLEPDPEAEQRLQEVVHNLYPGCVIRLPVLHEPGTSYPENKPK